MCIINDMWGNTDPCVHSRKVARWVEAGAFGLTLASIVGWKYLADLDRVAIDASVIVGAGTGVGLGVGYSVNSRSWNNGVDEFLQVESQWAWFVSIWNVWSGLPALHELRCSRGVGGMKRRGRGMSRRLVNYQGIGVSQQRGGAGIRERRADKVWQLIGSGDVPAWRETGRRLLIWERRW